MFCTPTPGLCAGCSEPFPAGAEVIYDERGMIVAFDCGCAFEYVSSREAAEIIAERETT